MTGPLSGVRVIDLTSVFMGPYCTSILGDLGADVIKVESPSGDSTRYLGPSRSQGMGGMFLQLGRNKKSIVLDLKTEKGKEVLFRLIEKADVFVHSMRPQAIEKLGLNYEEVAIVNKQIIYCNSWGFRKDGPYASQPAYDDVIQAKSGLVAVQAKLTGSPQYMATVVADKTAGIVAANSIMAALYYRERTGEGQSIEVPMFETMTAYTMLEHLFGLNFDPPLAGSMYPRSTSKFRKPYRTMDGYMCCMIYNDRQWSTFFEVTGNKEYITDERFIDIGARTRNIDALYGMVEEIMLTKTTAEWVKVFEDSDLPGTMMNTPEDLLEDEHLKEINFFQKVDHPTEGPIINVDFPVRFSKSEQELRNFAPRLGENTVQILTELGYISDEIEEIVKVGNLMQIE